VLLSSPATETAPCVVVDGGGGAEAIAVSIDRAIESAC